MKNIKKSSKLVFITSLQSILESAAIILDNQEMDGYLMDYQKLYKAQALAVVFPKSAAEVSLIIKLCSKHNIAITPQGGNTGLCAGAIPIIHKTTDHIIMNMSRMNKIRGVNLTDNMMTVEAGCILKEIQNIADSHNRMFPLSLGAEGSCQIGGNVSTNAGGLNVLQHGMARNLVLGIEVVLPNGDVLSSLTGLQKNNVGYDWKQLFIGAEGTLGIITAVNIKLYPKSKKHSTILVSCKNLIDIVTLLQLFREHLDNQLTSFELIPDITFDLCQRFSAKVRCPLQNRMPFYVLIEISSASAHTDLSIIVESILEKAFDLQIIADAVQASSEQQRQKMWFIREAVIDMQRQAEQCLKNDISVLICDIPKFIEDFLEAVSHHPHNLDVIIFGHIGDGNLHINFIPKKQISHEVFMSEAKALKKILMKYVRQYSGSFSAEHGVGQTKKDLLGQFLHSSEISMMHAIKKAFDPKNIMNPGKIL